MNIDHIEPNLKIKTINTLNPTSGMLIKQHYLDNRKPNEPGTVLGYVSGHGGDVWWIQHTHAHDVAPYWVHEFEPVTNQS
jgi:hypothetical protein